jgi:biopolymer transport protein ExbB/TolQ
MALVTTFLGLTVAIPTSVAFNFLKNRLLKVSMEVGAITSDLFERFRQPAA